MNPLQPATPLVTADAVTATVPAARALNAAGQQLPDTFPSPSLPSPQEGGEASCPRE